MKIAILKYVATKIIGQLLCRFGFHNYDGTAILADLDTYWMKCGARCLRCGAGKISFNEASTCVKIAFDRGKQTSETSFLAYGKGVKKVVDLYGKDYVYKLIDKS